MFWVLFWPATADTMIICKYIRKAQEIAALMCNYEYFKPGDLQSIGRLQSWIIILAVT